MKITKEMVVQLNNELAAKGCAFRYEYNEEKLPNTPCIETVLVSKKYVNGFIINHTMEYFNWLETWFTEKGIELAYNDKSNVIWSNGSWHED